MLPNNHIAGPASAEGSQRQVVAVTPRHKIPVTVVIPALNEATRIRSLVEALDWADEVIVADGGSVDATREAAAVAGARVVHAIGVTIASQRNAGTETARNRWILALDADERVSAELRDEIALTVVAPQHEAYRIRFRNFYLGHEIRHGRWGSEWHVRLFQSHRRFLDLRVHERLEPINNLGSLTNPLEHSSYLNLTHHLEKMVRYSRWAAEDLFASGRRSGFWDLTASPVWRFFREYVMYGGWRDGRPGLMVAALSACAALLKYAQLMALEWETKAEILQVVPRPLAPVPIRPAELVPPKKARLISSES